MEVSAEQGARSHGAELELDGTFAIHLPAGRYRLVAVGDEWVAAVDDVDAVAGATVDVRMVLIGAARIAGTLHASRAALGDVEVRVRRAGTEVNSGRHHRAVTGRRDVQPAESDELERFVVDGLLPGVSYDVTIGGTAIRETTVRAVIAPAENLEVILQSLPVLRGAIGLASEGCPIGRVEIADGEGYRVLADVEPDCHFASPGLPAGRSLEVRADGGGWHLSERFVTPEDGDPPPVCLNPPCGAPIARAAVEVQLEGAPADGSMNVQAQAGERAYGCHSTGARCVTEIPPGTKVTFGVFNRECAREERQTLTVHAGRNAVVFHCRRLRMIQGVLRYPGLLRNTDVRCAGGEPGYGRGHIFQVRCPVDASAIEFRAEGGGTWRQAPVPAGSHPAIVDVDLPP
jgi:hypothetical protein